ncbi:UNVERIFIED_CONTAM: alkyl hydroperoxide reductase subunit F [Acetivibrio alkalicellulosi]
MLLDVEIKQQLEQYLALLEGDIVIKVSAGSDSISTDMLLLIDELAKLSSKIHVEKAELDRTPSFSVNRLNEDTGIVFAGIPLGHEFTSLVLALLQVGGRAPKVDDTYINQIKQLKGKYHFETYISLSCHNCPDVVQALNIMSVINPNITHTMIDGAVFKEEVESKDIMAVPAVYLNGNFFESGRLTLEEILAKLGQSADTSSLNEKEPFDVLVIGGGPASVSSAIYSARKGLRTGIIAERFGGQVLDTMGIENFISVPYTEGPKLAENLKDHVKRYNVDIINLQKAKNISRKELLEVELEKGAVVKSKTVIIATGARWRNVNVPGEKELKNKGVAYCPHCDGPLFAGKDVAVIGGGNSGVEAAIDLAGIVRHVTVLEFMPELKADRVLQERLYRLPNITVLTNVQTKEFTGKEKLDGITYIERDTKEEKHIELQGVFIQIGLIPNTEWLDDSIERNPLGEIIVNQKSATSMPGVFAAGDCTDSPYKQIIISMGSGATAALSAFDYLIRN